MDETDVIWRAVDLVNNHIPQLGTTAFYTLCIMTFIAFLRKAFKKQRRLQREPHQTEQEVGLDRSRKLCKIESSVDTLHKYGGSITANVLLVKSQISLQTSSVRQALSHLTKQHPLLCTKIDRVKMVLTNGRKRIVKHFREMENPNFADYHLKLKATTADQWLTVFERELQKKFPVEGPLWRFVMLKEQFDPVEGRYSNAFVFSAHHLVSDGVSAFVFFKEFLDCLNTATPSSEDSKTDYQVLPSFSHLMRNHITISQHAILYERSKLLFQNIFQTFQPMQVYKNIFTSKFHPVILSDPAVVKKTCLLPRILEESEVSQLVVMCKSRRCTIHGAFSAAASIAAATLLRNEQSSGETISIPASFQVNVRKNCHPEVSVSELGCYFVDCPIEIPVCHSITTELNFWEIAENASKIVHTAVAKGTHVHSARLTNVLHSNQNKYLGELSKDSNVAGRTSSVFSISNLGRFQAEASSGQAFKFDGFYYAVAEHNTGPVFAHNIVTVSGILYWGITYHTNVVTEKQAKHYAKLVIDTLRNAIANH